MSGIETAIRQRMIDALTAAPSLSGRINGVFEPGTAGMTAPYVLIGATLSRDWGTKDRDGRELVAIVSVHDDAREGAGVSGLADDVARVVTGMKHDGDAIEIGSITLRKASVRRTRDGQWIATLDFRMRALVA